MQIYIPSIIYGQSRTISNDYCLMRTKKGIITDKKCQCKKTKKCYDPLKNNPDYKTKSAYLKKTQENMLKSFQYFSTGDLEKTINQLEKIERNKNLEKKVHSLSKKPQYQKQLKDMIKILHQTAKLKKQDITKKQLESVLQNAVNGTLLKYPSDNLAKNEVKSKNDNTPSIKVSQNSELKKLQKKRDLRKTSRRRSDFLNRKTYKLKSIQAKHLNIWERVSLRYMQKYKKIIMGDN